jgi:hypothetical protein
LGTWYLEDFQKKLETKLFIFTVKKKFHSHLFLLSFGPRVHFRSQTLTFWSNTPEFKFQSKLSNYHISLWRKVFFSFLTNFFSFILKLPNVARSHRRKNKKNSRFLGTWYLEDFQKKLGTKLFIFTVKKNSTLIFFT